MDWNADLYENKHDFVAEYGRDLLSNVPENPGQAILDLGCGTGTLTHALLEKSTSVVGLDASPEMIGKARQLYPGMDFRVLDACLMPWNNWFDVIFSNAAFHWIPDHGALLKAVSRALKPQGKLICEFGAHRNILRIREAFRPSLERMNLPYKTRFYFPTVEEYRSMLEQAGLRPEVVMDFDRPTPLKDGQSSSSISTNGSSLPGIPGGKRADRRRCAALWPDEAGLHHQAAPVPGRGSAGQSQSV